MLGHVVADRAQLNVWGFSSISIPTLPAAISRKAITVGLSRSGSSSGCEPALIWRARLVAASVSSKRFGMWASASSIVMRAMALHSGQLSNQRPMSGTLLRATQPRRPHDSGQVVDGRSKLLINNNIIELAAVAHFLARRVEPALDGLGIVLAPPQEALPEQGDRRRQDEDVDRLRNEFSHLRCPLPVDLEQDVLAGFHLVFKPAPAGRVPVAVHVRVLQKLSGVFQSAEGLRRHEMIVDAIGFPRARWPCRIRHR